MRYITNRYVLSAAALVAGIALDAPILQIAALMAASYFIGADVQIHTRDTDVT